MSVEGQHRLRFGKYEIDGRAGKLFRDGLQVKLQPQPFLVLTILLERPGELVSREQFRERVWGGATFVEFDQGLNYCIRQVRLALQDGAFEPVYIETLPKQGYRFIAPVTGKPLAEPPVASRKWILAAAAGALSVIAVIFIYASFRNRSAPLKYTQLTDFTDSATAPALSPDGRVLAFIRGRSAFLSADQIYVKMLPNGEPRRLTDDPRAKYGLAFSPDGSQIAYTVLHTPDWSTYVVPVLGGESRLFMDHAAGLTWLDQGKLLFSRIRSGLHLGVVTGTEGRDGVREVYFPPHERGMAHYSYASPDRRWALVVEMNGNGDWAPCRLVSMDGSSVPKAAGPNGACTSAGWSPDGTWMYFAAVIDGQSHLWRQRFPNGQPEQITFGPAEEEGIAVDPNGRSIITSVGVHESAIWLHDERGERSMSSEGEVITRKSPPSFSADGRILYYLLRRNSAGPDAELWRMNVATGSSEPVFPGVSMIAYDVSPDGKQVVYSTRKDGNASQVWMAAADRASPAKRIGEFGPTIPYFGLNGKILLFVTERSSNYLEQMNQDGSGRTKVFDYPINVIQCISPGRRWVIAVVSRNDGAGVEKVAIPTDGGSQRQICTVNCGVMWSPNGKFLFISVDEISRTSPGRSLAIPVGPGETLPEFPPDGIAPGSNANAIGGAQSVDRAELVPGNDPSHFAYVNSAVHRNLYRISLP